MTPTTDIDRLLGSVLEVDGPQSVPPGLVDAALAEARTVGQRRPLMRVMDRLAWPSSRIDGRGWVLIGTVSLLLLALMAALVVGPGRGRPPLDPLGDGRRVVYTTGTSAAVMDALGVHRFVLQPTRQQCVQMLPGRNVGIRDGIGSWRVVDIASGRQLASLDTNYAGFERWSVERDSLALVDVSGQATIATFEDPSAPKLAAFDLPGLRSLALSRDGRRVAVAILDGTTLTIDVIDVETSQRATVYAVESERQPTAIDTPTGELFWGSDAEHVVLTRPDEETPALDVATWIVPFDGRPAIRVDTAGGVFHASPDGSRFAVEDRQGGLSIIDAATGAAVAVVDAALSSGWLAWSDDGHTLAILGDGALRLVEADGTNLRTPITGVAAAAWLPDQSGIAVARTVRGAVMIDAVDTDNGTLHALTTIDEVAPGEASCLFADRVKKQP